MEKINDVGIILKTERESRGLTLEVIQEATKIPIDSLKAIEEGYKIRTLTAFYYKSFVRLYALHLGLDPLPILAMIPSYQSVNKVVSVERSSAVEKSDVSKINIVAGHPQPVHWQAAIPFVLLGLAAILVAGGLFVVVKAVAGKVSTAIAEERAKPRATVKKTKVEKAPIKSIKVEKTEKITKVEPGEKITKIEKSVKPVKVEAVARAEKPVRVEKIIPVEKPTAESVQAEVPVAVIEPKKVETVESSVEKVKVASKVSLTVRATVTAWLTVKSDGSVVFKGSLKKGNAESWSASKKIEISGKEVDQLEYEVNGKTIGKLSRRDSKARRVVVTPEGLSVEK